jgi:hypothetical protein
MAWRAGICCRRTESLRQKILDFFNESGFDWSGQKHPAIVLPGIVCRFSGELEDLFAGKTKIMVAQRTPDASSLA